MLVSKTIANLVNGVSQQPPTIRNPTQCEAQENLLSDTVYGVVKRPPFQFVKRLWTSAGSYQPFVHTINQNPDSQYKVVIANGDLKVFDLDGTAKTVSFPDGKAYLASTNNLQDFQCLSLGNKTYILNRTVTVAKTVTTSPVRRTEALVFVKQGDYSTDYIVTWEGSITGGLAVVYVPTAVTKTTHASNAADIKTSQIATDLNTGISAATGFTNVCETIEQVGSVLWIQTKLSGGGVIFSMSLSAEDSKGNNNLRLIRSQIQKFADLPTIAPDGYVVQVVGDKTSAYDDYYVKFVVDVSNPTNTIDFGIGAWEESCAPGTLIELDSSTLPLVLTDNLDGTFTCAEEEWDDLEVGDSVSNLDPSFVGKTIQYLFTFANRLGVLSGDRVIMSEVGVYTNFYLTTVTTFLDSDPIDIQPLQGQGDWLYAVPLAEKLILFSSKAQAVINGSGDLLTPKTASLKTTTRYPVSPTCEPVILGSNIIFAADNGEFGKVYEYYVQREIETLQAADITSHVPKYIPKGLYRLTGDDDSRTLVACGIDLTDGTNPAWEFYVYKYYWINDQKVQSSWSRWSLPNDTNVSWKVSDAHLLNGFLYLTVFQEDSEEILLLKCSLDISAVDQNGYTTHLDMRLDGSTLSSSTGLGLRTYTLPFVIPEELRGSLRAFENHSGGTWGSEVECTVSADGTEATVPDDHHVWLGFTYDSRFTFSEIHFKEEQNGNQVPTEVGKLTIKRMDILYTGTLYFRAEVTPRNRDMRTYVMTPYILGDPTPLEDVGPRDGKFSIPVNAENTKYTLDIVNDSVVQSRIQSAEWTGNYSILSQRA